MKKSINYDKYYKTTLKLLKDKLLANGVSENNLREFYPYKTEKRISFLDLVELDANGRLLKVYVIKSFFAVESIYNNLTHIIERYRGKTGADVYLVYQSDNGTLEIKSYDDLNKNERIIDEPVLNCPVVNSFITFYGELIKQCDYDSELRFFFRGHSKDTYESIPSIYRDNNIEYERNMYLEAIRNNPSEFTEDMSTFDKLVKMQHYELPTRLLDITTNPLVALYFACKENDDHDGAVMIFPMYDNQIKYYNSDFVCILSNLSQCDGNFDIINNKDQLVAGIKLDKPNFNSSLLLENPLNEVFCVLPKLNNDRIIRQNGAFFIFGMGESKNVPAKFKDKPKTIKIQASGKKAILKELQVLGIDEATLFPETDKMMKRIKSQFKNN